jgi:hypothetical protein
MAVISPPAYLQSGSHSAQGDRQVVSALAGQDIETFTNGVSATGVGHGLVRSGHLAVSEKSGTPDMSVDVAAGLALVTGSSSLAQGVYVFSNDATVNLAIATADATNPRYDLVIAQVRDNTEDSGGSNDARLAVVTGTPAASPADPAVPDGCLALARVEVAALASSIVDADITALAGLARGSSWNQAWGEVAYASTTTAQNGVTTTVDLTGLSVTFTAVPGRKYRTTLYVSRVAKNTAAGAASASITDATPTDLSLVSNSLAASELGQLLVQLRETGLSGSITRKGRIATSGANDLDVQSATSRPSFIMVEDIGPA